MQPNEIARSSIYSRGVLAVVGKAKFFRLRFKLRRAYNGGCYWKLTERARRRNVDSNRGYNVPTIQARLDTVTTATDVKITRADIARGIESLYQGYYQGWIHDLNER